jgi:nitroreductase
VTESLLPVLRRRWSLCAFDADHDLTADQVSALLEAARWAPSAGNSQPWAFHPVARHDDGWSEVVDHLTASSRASAIQAVLLLVNICHARVEDTDWEYSEFAQYDLGQAVATCSSSTLHGPCLPAVPRVRS